MRELLRRAISSVLADSTGLDSEIIIVDNASRDGTAAMVSGEFPLARLICNGENRGFTRANNQALAIARGRYLFLLNPDAQIVPGATSEMVGYMEDQTRVGILGPQVLNPDLTIQSSRRRFPTLITALLESTRLQQQFPNNRLLSRYYLSDTGDNTIQAVDWVVGAAMLVRRQVYEQVGGLDEGYFMYSEELDWCHRAKASGWQVVYFPRARVIHHVGKSSEQDSAARDIYFHTSKIRYFRKFHGPMTAGLLRACLLSMFVFQIGEEGAKWLLGHKRPLRANRVKAYWQVITSGLR